MAERTEKKYPQLNEYVRDKRESFEECPFGEVDALALSSLAYIRFENIVPPDDIIASPIPVTQLLKAEYFDRMLSGHMLDMQRRELLINFAISPRYRGTKLNHYTNIVDKDKCKQFSALTFTLDDHTAFVAFRGTDNTLVGWRENFNMAFMCPVPAQQAAAEYLNNAAKLSFRKLRVGGHSKGGNLAVYAAMNCKPEVRERILDVYSHDGPGFKEQILSSPEFAEILPKLHKIMPEASVVGTLLEQSQSYKVVASSAEGVEQHDAFSWQIDGDDFRYLESLSRGAKLFDNAFDRWMGSMDEATRQRMVELIFTILEETGSTTMSGAEIAFRAAGFRMQRFMTELDSESKKYLFRTFMSFASAYMRTLTSNEKRAKDGDSDED